MLTTSVKTPLRQSSPFLMDRCRVTQESFSKMLSFVAAGTAPTRPGFLFSTVACRCFMEGSWRSIICWAWVGGGSGGTRLWWMMLRSFQILTWETGPHCELSGKTPHKSMSIWSINIAAKGYLCITGFVAGYEHVQIDSSAWIPSLSVEVTSHKWLKIYRRKIKIVKKKQPHEQLSEAVLGHRGALN